MSVIGIYGGTFNPVHLAHLNMAIQMKEIHDLDEVWLIPVREHPFNKECSLASFALRMRMLELALVPYPYLKALDIEGERGGTSYTIDTLREIKKRYPEYSLRLILGEDALDHFHLWKEPEEILRLAPPLIGRRLSKDHIVPYISPFVTTCLEIGQTKTLNLEISSTLIRHRIEQKLEYRHLLSSKVFEFIEENALYL